MEVTPQLVRDGATVIAVVGVTTYFVYENNKLKKRIQKLEKETTDLAKYVKVLETKFATAINKAMSAHPPQNPREYVRRHRRTNSRGSQVNTDDEDSREEYGNEGEYEEDEYPVHVERSYSEPQHLRRRNSRTRVSNEQEYQEENREEYGNNHQGNYVEEEYIEEEAYVQQPRQRRINREIMEEKMVEAEKHMEERNTRQKPRPVRANRPVINNSPVSIEVIEDDDLLDDIEEMASNPRSEGMAKQNEGRPSTGSKVKERMSRTKQIAEAMRLKREQKVKAEQVNK